jgi:hypothetical protein
MERTRDEVLLRMRTPVLFGAGGQVVLCPEEPLRQPCMRTGASVLALDISEGNHSRIESVMSLGGQLTTQEFVESYVFPVSGNSSGGMDSVDGPQRAVALRMRIC